MKAQTLRMVNRSSCALLVRQNRASQRGSIGELGHAVAADAGQIGIG